VTISLLSPPGIRVLLWITQLNVAYNDNGLIIETKLCLMLDVFAAIRRFYETLMGCGA